MAHRTAPHAATGGRITDRAAGQRIALVVCLSALVGCAPVGAAPSVTPASTASPVATPTGTASTRANPVPSSQLPAGVTASTRVPGAPLALGFGFGSVWVTSHRGRTLSRLDPSSAAVTATIDLGSGACGDIGIGAGQAWVFTCPLGQTLRIDPDTNEIAGVAPAAGGAMPAFGAGSVWLPSGRGPGGRVLRVDPATDRIDAEIRVGDTPGYAVYAFDAVWVSNLGEATVSRIDPATNSVTATIPVGPPGRPGSGFMGVAGPAVWVANTADGSLYRIDPERNEAQRVDIDARQLTEFYDLFVGEGAGSLWVRTEDRVVTRLDPATAQVLGTYPAGSGGGDVGATDDALWVANFGDDTVWKVAHP